MARARVSVVVCAAALGIAASAHANILNNPSFENPLLGGGDLLGAPGWNAYGGGTYTLAQSIGVPAHEGVQVMKTFGFSGVFQDHPVLPGDNVSASAWMLNWSSDPIQSTNTGAYAQLLLIFLAGDATTQIGPTLVNEFMQPVPAFDTWIQRSINAVAPAGSAYVRFQLNTGNAEGGAIMYDDASLTVPAPTAGVLGLVGLAALRRRRAR